MPAYTTISNALVAVGAKPFATTIQALRDNPLAIAEGDATAPRIQFAAMGTWFTAVGAVGSYAFMRINTLTTLAPGATIAGSSLRYSHADGAPAFAGAPSGTWRCMGETVNSSGGTSTSLFVRIS